MPATHTTRPTPPRPAQPRLAQVLTGPDHDPRFDPAEATDLRRRRSAELAQRVLDRAPLLAPGDRALLEAVFRDHRPLTQIADLLGLTPKVVRRRTRQAITRALSDRVAWVARHAPGWSPVRRRVAIACVVEGRPLRDAARTLNLSLHTVRRHAETIHAAFEAYSDAQRDIRADLSTHLDDADHRPGTTDLRASLRRWRSA
jgi:DNA-directed RNA polymerase specialized sigma24 family protein